MYSVAFSVSNKTVTTTNEYKSKLFLALCRYCLLCVHKSLFSVEFLHNTTIWVFGILGILPQMMKCFVKIFNMCREQSWLSAHTQ